ncbi:MAG: response regulator [Nitrospira sp.]|nr:response regulator [Nitrospira sp.]
MTGGPITALAGSERSVARLQGTVLIVDADEGVRQGLHELLQAERVSIRLSGSGQEALAMVKQKAPALLIVDASLPDRDGIAVLEEAQRIDSRMIGVVMAEAASVDLAVRAMRAGFSDVITKPFERDRVLATVRRLLELHRLRTDQTVLKHAAVRSGAVQMQSVPFQTFGDGGTQKGADGLTEYERGLEEGRRYSDAQHRQDLAVLTEAVRKFDAARSVLQKTVDDEVIALALQIASKILHEAAESSREQIVMQVKAALGAVQASDEVVIQVHPADAAVLETVRAELTGRQQVALKLTIEPVASLQRGSCLVHTATRLADASLDTQLLRLGDALRNRAHHES